MLLTYHQMLAKSAIDAWSEMPQLKRLHKCKLLREYSYRMSCSEVFICMHPVLYNSEAVPRISIQQETGLLGPNVSNNVLTAWQLIQYPENPEPPAICKHLFSKGKQRTEHKSILCYESYCIAWRTRSLRRWMTVSLCADWWKRRSFFDCVDALPFRFCDNNLGIVQFAYTCLLQKERRYFSTTHKWGLKVSL